MLQVSANYRVNYLCDECTYQPYMVHEGTILVNFSCDECMYQPYIEGQETPLIIFCMMNTHPEVFVSYLAFNPILNVNFYEYMTVILLIRIST